MATSSEMSLPVPQHEGMAPIGGRPQPPLAAEGEPTPTSQPIALLTDPGQQKQGSHQEVDRLKGVAADLVKKREDSGPLMGGLKGVGTLLAPVTIALTLSPIGLLGVGFALTWIKPKGAGAVAAFFGVGMCIASFVLMGMFKAAAFVVIVGLATTPFGWGILAAGALVCLIALCVAAYKSHKKSEAIENLEGELRKGIDALKAKDPEDPNIKKLEDVLAYTPEKAEKIDAWLGKAKGVLEYRKPLIDKDEKKQFMEDYDKLTQNLKRIKEINNEEDFFKRIESVSEGVQLMKDCEAIMGKWRFYESAKHKQGVYLR